MSFSHAVDSSLRSVKSYYFKVQSPDFTIKFRLVLILVIKFTNMPQQYHWYLAAQIREIGKKLLQNIVLLKIFIWYFMSFNLSSPNVCQNKHLNDELKIVFSRYCFRFPIPDLRPVHERGRYPWCQRNIRKDVLFVSMVDATFVTEINCESMIQEYHVTCKELAVKFQVSLVIFYIFTIYFIT